MKVTVQNRCDLKGVKNKWWGNISRETINYINDLVKQWPCRMFEIKRGYIYIVVDHYMYIDFKREAKRVKLSECSGQDGYYYITHNIKI